MLRDYAAGDHLSVSGSGCRALLSFVAANGSPCSTSRRPGPLGSPTLNPDGARTTTNFPSRRGICSSTTTPVSTEPLVAPLL